MTSPENRQSKDYFSKSKRIWFPDFEEVLESKENHYHKLGDRFSSLSTVLRFFRGELSRAQFAAQFLQEEAPQKMLSSHRALYNCAHTLCTAYQNRSICDIEFDERLLLSFRNRPTEDVFAPAPEAWDEITRLLSRLETKSQRLPIFFDGLAWGSYLKGIVTSRQYAATYLNWDTGGYLAQLLDYGVDPVKASLQETYSMEVSAALRLKELCFDYNQGLLSCDDFNARFLQLAGDFCSDITE